MFSEILFTGSGIYTLIHYMKIGSQIYTATYINNVHNSLPAVVVSSRPRTPINSPTEATQRALESLHLGKQDNIDKKSHFVNITISICGFDGPLNSLMETASSIVNIT